MVGLPCEEPGSCHSHQQHQEQRDAQQARQEKEQEIDKQGRPWEGQEERLKVGSAPTLAQERQVGLCGALVFGCPSSSY